MRSSQLENIMGAMGKVDVENLEIAKNRGGMAVKVSSC